MKKKIILITALFTLFAGVVSASSVNGDYKGNPIVIVKSDGKVLETDEVPAMINDGHTVVPISLLRQLGASVTWDQESYSVNVTLPHASNQNDINSIAASAKALNNGIVSYTSAGNEFGGTITFFYNGDLLSGGVFTSIETVGLLKLSLKTDANIVRIYDDKDNILSVETKFVKNYANGIITEKELSEKYIFTKGNTLNGQVTQPTNIPTTTTNVTPPTNNNQQCKSILSQYEVDKNNATTEANRRGGVYSGGLEYQLKILEDNKNSLLKSLGCPQ